MSRYVILYHDWPKPHFDLMLESGDALRTWRVARRPRPGDPVAGEPLPPHRRAYLEYEGPISGGRGRVGRVASGAYELLADSPGRVTVRLSCVGVVTIREAVMHSTEAFVERFDLPPTSPGPLDGLTFAVKDLFDVAGRVTGCGNPTWAETHGPAAAHAVAVEQLLAAGASAVGKTVTDELAYSLLGENHHFGTPLNPAAPDRMPGGSSSGSASAVAQGLADFALGTDTGGSVRVPAGNCGLFGWRPTHGRVSAAGVAPLSPGFDTVGLFARDAGVLRAAAHVLLGVPEAGGLPPPRVVLLGDAFLDADAEVREALQPALDALRANLPQPVTEVSLAEAAGASLHDAFDIYRVLMGGEAWSVIGEWVDRCDPEFGTAMTQTVAMARSLDRSLIPAAVTRRERLAAALGRYLAGDVFLAMPTTPTTALPKGTPVSRDDGPRGYFPRTLGFTALAGVGRLPQVSLPVGTAGGLPVGLSLLAGCGRDAELLARASTVFNCIFLTGAL